MKKRTGYLLLAIIGIVVSTIAVILLNRPLPIALNSPEAQPIKDALLKNRKIEAILYCDPESDVNLLNEVIIDAPDYQLNKRDKELIANYLGEEFIKNAGYLTFQKAQHLWDRSGDPYPTTGLAREKSRGHCPNPLPQSDLDLDFLSIAVRENRAIVIYNGGPYKTEAILSRIDGVWLIVSLRDMAVIL
jgi:hypothetical protein